MKKTATTTTTITKELQYVSKLVINGVEVSQTAKQVTCNIKGTDVTLNCTYISEFEIKDAYTSRFTTSANGKEIEVVYAKVNNRVSASIYIDSILAFSSLSMQAVFTVLNVAYGINKSSLNNLYVKSNSMRKQLHKSTSNIKVDSSFNF